MKQILHVAQVAIAKNRKQGTNDPAIIVRTAREAKRAHEVELVNPKTGEVLGKFVYRPHDPLPCGARLWLEADTKDLICRPVQKSAPPARVSAELERRRGTSANADRVTAPVES